MAMKTFYVGVKALITDGDNVLLVRGNDPDRRFWDTPGGRIDDDEDLLQTLDRELHEELPNIAHYEVGNLIHAERIHKDIVGSSSLVLVFYEVKNTQFSDELPEVSAEHNESLWMPFEQALTEASPAVVKALKQLVASRNR